MVRNRSCIVAVLYYGIGLLPLGAQSPFPTREGNYWVDVTTGVAIIPPASRLRIETDGSIAVQASSTPRITYKLTRRVRTNSGAEAVASLRQIEMRSVTRGNSTSLVIRGPRNRAVMADLVLAIPRDLISAAFVTSEGAISISGIECDVDAQTGAGRIDVDRLGGNAVVRAGGGQVQAGSVRGSLRCILGGGAIHVDRVGGEAWLETAGGDIFVHEALAAIHAVTQGGNIRVDRAAGAVEARTGEGIIEVGHAGGLVTAETAGGAIQVDAAPGVRCESATGLIRLRNMEGVIRAATAHGSILAQLLAGHRIEDVLLSTLAGDITVILSSNIPVTVQARNESAGGIRLIISDFSEIRVRAVSGEPAGPAVAEGSLNGGGPVLRLVANSGTIYLRRQK